MPDLTHRSHASELMDDLSIDDERLTRSLDQLRVVNRLLGGYGAIFHALMPYMTRAEQQGLPVRVLDVGTGIGDIPAFLMQETGIRRWDVEVTGVDLNPATIEYAVQYLSRTLDPSVGDRILLETADATALPYPDGYFDIAMASMFLHHFRPNDAVEVLAEMNRVSRDGVLINDLHRHELAYWSIAALTRVLPATEMVRHDAPLSVARGFKRSELYRLARKAGLARIRIRWRWAFRWVLVSGRL